MTATTIIVSAPGAPGMVSSSNQLVELNTATGSLIGITNGLTAYTASLKGAIEVNGQNVNVLGTLTAQEIYTTYVTSSVMFKSGSTKFGDDTSDKHEFTGSLKARLGTNENLNIFSLGSGDMRVSAINDAADTTVQLSIQGSPLILRGAGGAETIRIATDGGINAAGPVTASQGLRVNGTNYAFKTSGGGTAHQTLVGQCTAAATTVAKKIAFVGFTHAIRVNIWANQDSGNGATAVADIVTLYGSTNGGAVYTSPLGNVSVISVAYNNGGSPAYTIDVTLTYTGAAPTINYSIVGLSSDAMYAIT
jgi:hypothetical protein